MLFVINYFDGGLRKTIRPWLTQGHVKVHVCTARTILYPTPAATSARLLLIVLCPTQKRFEKSVQKRVRRDGGVMLHFFPSILVSAYMLCFVFVSVRCPERAVRLFPTCRRSACTGWSRNNRTFVLFYLFWRKTKPLYTWDLLAMRK